MRREVFLVIIELFENLAKHRLVKYIFSIKGKPTENTFSFYLGLGRITRGNLARTYSFLYHAQCRLYSGPWSGDEKECVHQRPPGDPLHSQMNRTEQRGDHLCLSLSSRRHRTLLFLDFSRTLLQCFSRSLWRKQSRTDRESPRPSQPR